MRQPKLVKAMKVTCVVDPDGCYIRVFRHRLAGGGIEMRTLETPLDGEGDHEVYPAIVRFKPGVLMVIGPSNIDMPPERWTIIVGDIGTDPDRLHEVVIEPSMLAECITSREPQFRRSEAEAHTDSEKLTDLFWKAIADFAQG